MYSNTINIPDRRFAFNNEFSNDINSICGLFISYNCFNRYNIVRYIVIVSLFSIVQKPNLWEIITTDDRLKILALALQAADLDDVTEQLGSTTVFAPSDAAFAKVPQDIITQLLDPANKNELATILAYHAVGEKILTSTDILKMNLPLRLQTLSGDYVTITKQGNQVKVNDATVITADIMASNGIIHIIDAVLVPESSSK